MSSFFGAFGRLAGAGLAVVFAAALSGQNSYAPQASEYAVVGALPGDQVNPALAISPAGGFLVWEDNLTDGEGTAIVAQRLGPNLAGLYGSFRVNQQGAREQQKPQVALLNNGGAVIVWQGNQLGTWDIYATFVASNGTFVTSDLLVNTTTNADQITPAVACLADGKVVIVWGSFEQDGSLQGVYGRLYSAEGASLGGEFAVNTATMYNQRTPVVAALPSGTFVVAWVSEHLSTLDSMRADICGQLFSGEGQRMGGEFPISTTTNICANPTITAFTTGGYLVAWGQKTAADRGADFTGPDNSWDIFARTFQPSGKPVQQNAFRVNLYSYGDQFAPRASALGNEALLVWNSLGQDGSREGVFGQFVSNVGSRVGDALAVNTTTINQQLTPAVAADGQNHLLAVWTSFAGLATSFDLLAQRFEKQQSPLAAPAAPYVAALSQSKLSVAWPVLAGYAVAGYDLYVDDAQTPITVTSNSFTVAGLAAGSTHTFKLAYRLTDGRVSPASGAATGTTWGGDDNYDGLPDDWQSRYFGANAAAWPAANADNDGDGVSNLQEFLAGTNPADAASVLKVGITTSPQGCRLVWSTVPGQVYQVQVASQLGVWSDFEAPRLAATNTDSLAVSGALQGAFYRIVRIR